MARWIGGDGAPPTLDGVIGQPTTEFALTTPDSGSTYQFTGADFGAVHPARSLVLIFSFAGGPISISSITIGGVTASVLATRTNGATVYIAHAKVPSGTSGNIAVNLSSAASITPDAMLIKCRYVRNVTAFDSGTDANSTTSAMSVTLNVPAKGIVIAAGSGVTIIGETPTPSWTNADNLNPSALITFSGRLTGAARGNLSANASYAVSLSISNARNHALAVAVLR